MTKYAICRKFYQEMGNNYSNKIKVSSAAMTYFHLNESADSRIQKVCAKNGIDISHHRSKQMRKIDWYTYDYIVALDDEIFQILQETKPPICKSRILLFNTPYGICDPYYGGRIAFSQMFNEIKINMEPFLRENNLVNLQIN